MQWHKYWGDHRQKPHSLTARIPLFDINRIPDQVQNACSTFAMISISCTRLTMLLKTSYRPPELLPCMMLLLILVIFTILAPVLFIPVLSFEAFSTYTEAEEKADDSNTAEDTER